MSFSGFFSGKLFSGLYFFSKCARLPVRRMFFPLFLEIRMLTMGESFEARLVKYSSKETFKKAKHILHA
ncbi:hypothetical protein, partial [uncultured Fibrobacter sp.]|uniref:hypothetical protein n=1 Tax=uncultured Fibrobacter sp. TaxID=261512 RepID=UPI0028064E73